MKKKFAIIDIETTGGIPGRDKITEIAIVLHDGTKILDQFDTLINPERTVPPEITRITGITNEMVQNAPKFYEIAKQVVQMTEGAIFVAHNVRFDYGFIKEEFARLGFTYTRRQLCTVKLSRASFPGLLSYSLGNLITHFGIVTENRHRALDDTLATVEIFEKILKQENSKDKLIDIVNEGVKSSLLPHGITLDDIHALPEETGVYYFHDSNGDVIYVGKAKNIKARIFQHFNKITKKATRLYHRVHSISFEIFGSELLSLLVEAALIKEIKPEINVALRRTYFPYILVKELDKQGFTNLTIMRPSNRNMKTFDVIQEYSSIKSAKNHLISIVENFGLCQNKTGLKLNELNCHCLGSCEINTTEMYNEKVNLCIHEIQSLFDRDMLVLDDGRNKNEKTILLIRDGRYEGYGFVNSQEMGYGIEEMLETIKPITYYPIMNKLIWNTLNQENRLKIIPI